MSYDPLALVQKEGAVSLKNIRSYCVKHRLTVAAAESVTSGCIQLLLSSAEKAQDFFQGGLTTYNCAQKCLHLHIDPIFAERVDGVDERIAENMAAQVCRSFRSDIGIGITGYATTVPEKGVDTLYAYLCIVKNEEVVLRSKLSTVHEGIPAQFDYALQAVKMLSDILK